MGSIGRRGEGVLMWSSFQCSPTSRVGVNSIARLGKPRRLDVSVLSDEPCWGQLNPLARRLVLLTGFSALRRAVLGSIIVLHPQRSAPSSFSALRRAVLGSIGCRCRWCGHRRGFSALRRAVLGSMTFTKKAPDLNSDVSVLSDEPCWGQSFDFTHFAETGSVSVLSDEPCWGQCCNCTPQCPQ